jgi:hypothetical protein
MRSETAQHKEGWHVVEVLMSDKQKHFNLGLSTLRYSLSVVSDECAAFTCQVPEVYYKGDSDSVTLPDLRDNLDNTAYINAKHNLIQVDLSTRALKDTIEL